MISELKSLIVETLGIPPVVVLACAGLAAHLLANFVLDRPATSALGLLLAVALGLLVEGYEIYLAYRDVGLLAPGNDPVWRILLRHGADVLALVAMPVLLVGYGFVRST